VEIPEGHVGFLYPRSSIFKTSMRLTNAVGVIDSDYRGEIRFNFDNTHEWFGNFYKWAPRHIAYYEGDRIGQLVIMPIPKVEFEEVDELSSTDRGEGGFGSTGVT
jgi:dUTP pyrophosphatase